MKSQWKWAARLSALALISAFGAPIRAAGEKYVMYVGTIGGANKILAFTLDADSGKMEALGDCATTTRPSFIAISDDHKFLYATGGATASSRNPGIVVAFSIDSKTWKLTQLVRQPAEGSDPSYVSIDKTGKWLFNANYQNGSVSVYPIKEDGSIGPSSDHVQFSGKGTDPARQTGPHSHSIGVSPDNRFVFVPDLGLDHVSIFKLDAEKGKLIPNDPPFAEIDPGSGARHFKFSADGKFMYLSAEMKSTVTVFAYDAEKGALKQLQSVSMLPKDFKGTSAASELRIHPSGKWLYAANRGHDSIVRFSVDPATGLLTPEDWKPTGGKTPRQFNIDPTGQWMIVGNQDADSIQEFKIDKETGKLSATDQKFPVNRPSDFKFIKLD